MTERKTYGTAAPEAPIAREDFERAVRYLHSNDLDLRDLILRLAAQVVALTNEVGRRLPADGEESVEARIAAALPAVLERVQRNDARAVGRVWMETSLDNKYEIAGASPPCEELMPICQARCCRMVFPLSTADLDEGVIRWDYGQPYVIRQRASDGYCVHNDPASHGCTVHAQRPGACRRYDCREDKRIWIDYEKRIPVPIAPRRDDDEAPFDLHDRIRQKALAEMIELSSIRRTFPESEPAVGPELAPRTPRPTR